MLLDSICHDSDDRNICKVAYRKAKLSCKTVSCHLSKESELKAVAPKVEPTMEPKVKKVFIVADLLVAATVPSLVFIFANAYSESPFGNAPQMFQVMAIGLVWAILNLGLGIKERFRSIKREFFILNALRSVSPIIYFFVWNLFFRKY